MSVSYWISYTVVISSILGFVAWVMWDSFKGLRAWYLHHQRPPEPVGEDMVWYRGWEAGWDRTADFWTGEGYYACQGGVDLDAPQLRAGRWETLLDAIDEEMDYE